MKGDLVQIIGEMEDIMKMQAGIISRLFELLCQHIDEDEINNMDPVLTSMKDVAERMKKL